jgi:hypothetical protein
MVTMKSTFILNILLLLFSLVKAEENQYILKSPDQKVTVVLKSHPVFTYEVFYENQNLIYPSEISIDFLPNSVKEAKEGPPKVRRHQINESNHSGCERKKSCYI